MIQQKQPGGIPMYAMQDFNSRRHILSNRFDACDFASLRHQPVHTLCVWNSRQIKDITAAKLVVGQGHVFAKVRLRKLCNGLSSRWMNDLAPEATSKPSSVCRTQEVGLG